MAMTNWRLCMVGEGDRGAQAEGCAELHAGPRARRIVWSAPLLRIAHMGLDQRIQRLAQVNVNSEVRS
jgi:hypothetical protein